MRATFIPSWLARIAGMYPALPPPRPTSSTLPAPPVSPAAPPVSPVCPPRCRRRSPRDRTYPPPQSPFAFTTTILTFPHLCGHPPAGRRDRSVMASLPHFPELPLPHTLDKAGRASRRP